MPTSRFVRAGAVGARHQDRDQEHELVPFGRSARSKARSHRQIEHVESGGRVVQETRGWDEVNGVDAFDAQQRRSARLSLLSRSRSRAARGRSADRRAAARGAPGAAVAALRALHRRVRARRRSRRRSSSIISRWRTTSTASSTLSGNPQQIEQLRARRSLAARERDRHRRRRLAGVARNIVAELIALVEAKRSTRRSPKSCSAMWEGAGSPAAIVEREGLAQTSDPASDRALRGRSTAPPTKSVVADYQGRQEQRRRVFSSGR